VIRAQFRRRNGHIASFTISGHGGQGPYGQDILCAAVSALSQAAVLGLTDVVGIPVALEKKHGFLRCELPEDLDPRSRSGAAVLLETLLRSLKDLEQNYGDALAVVEGSRGGDVDGFH